MSKNRWSSFEKDKLIMEAWRQYTSEEKQYRFLSEGPEYILNEEDLQELFGKRAWEKLVDKFANQDEGAAQIAQRLGLSRVDVTDPGGKALDLAQIADKLKQLGAAAQKSGDPEVIDATKKLAQSAQQVAQATSAAAPGTPPRPGAPGEADEETTPAFKVSRPDLMAILKDPAGKIGPSMRFRSRIQQYLQTMETLPGGVHRNSPLIRGIVNIVRDSLIALGHQPPEERQHESINKIFLPIIIEEVKKEKVRRLSVEELTRVLNEKVRFKTIN